MRLAVSCGGMVCEAGCVVCRYGEPLYEEVKEFPTIVSMGTFVGFMFGGMIGTRHAGDKFIAMNHHSKFTSTMQAQVCE